MPAHHAVSGLPDRQQSGPFRAGCRRSGSADVRERRSLARPDEQAAVLPTRFAASVRAQASATWQQTRADSLTSFDAIDHALALLARAPERVLLMVSPVFSPVCWTRTGCLNRPRHPRRNRHQTRSTRRALWSETPGRPWNEPAQTTKGFPLQTFIFETSSIGSRNDAMNAVMENSLPARAACSSITIMTWQADSHNSPLFPRRRTCLHSVPARRCSGQVSQAQGAADNSERRLRADAARIFCAREHPGRGRNGACAGSTAKRSRTMPSPRSPRSSPRGWAKLQRAMRRFRY